MKKFTFVFLVFSLFPLTSWGAGSMGTPGGSLQRADLRYLGPSNFSESKWVRMKRPLAYGVIEHEFWGIEVTWDEGALQKHKWYTSGLVADDDIIYFRDELRRGLTSENFFTSYRTDDYPTFIGAVQKVRQSMAASYYNSGTLQFLAMVARPLLGQPCTLLASRIQQDLDELDLRPE